jgi:hypothetical protein
MAVPHARSATSAAFGPWFRGRSSVSVVDRIAEISTKLQLEARIHVSRFLRFIAAFYGHRSVESTQSRHRAFERAAAKGAIWLSERFYFDLENGVVTIADKEGVEAASFEEAMDEARKVVSEVAEEIAASCPGETWLLVVRDAAGSLVGRLPIKA